MKRNSSRLIFFLRVRILPNDGAATTEREPLVQSTPKKLRRRILAIDPDYDNAEHGKGIFVLLIAS